MLKFEDIANIPDQELFQINNDLTPSVLAKVIKTAPKEIAKKILSNIRSDVAMMIENMAEKLGDLSPSDIESARQKVLEVAENYYRTN
ncbi:MAG: FliG C-terminal domain-containing protein [Elusimicrobiota bacterium]